MNIQHLKNLKLFTYLLSTTCLELPSIFKAKEASSAFTLNYSMGAFFGAANYNRINVLAFYLWVDAIFVRMPGN